MNTPTMKYRVSRALTSEEMTLIIGNARRAATTHHLLFGIMADLYNALLHDEHRSIADMDVNRPLRPEEYAIPTKQWETIVYEATNRAAEWGTSVDTCLELINIKPDTYDASDAPIPETHTVDHRPAMLHLKMTREAIDTITTVDQYLGRLATAYGRDSQVYRTATDTWIQQLTLLFTLDAGRTITVRRDGHAGSLSLVADTASGMTVGIIFHRWRRHCTIPGCQATIGDDGTVRPLDEQTPVVDHDHQMSYPLGAPAPGEWLAHS